MVNLGYADPEQSLGLGVPVRGRLKTEALFLARPLELHIVNAVAIKIGGVGVMRDDGNGQKLHEARRTAFAQSASGKRLGEEGHWARRAVAPVPTMTAPEAL